jgi:hypothetical protein
VAAAASAAADGLGPEEEQDSELAAVLAEARALAAVDVSSLIEAAKQQQLQRMEQQQAPVAKQRVRRKPGGEPVAAAAAATTTSRSRSRSRSRSQSSSRSRSRPPAAASQQAAAAASPPPASFRARLDAVAKEVQEEEQEQRPQQRQLKAAATTTTATTPPTDPLSVAVREAAAPTPPGSCERIWMILRDPRLGPRLSAVHLTALAAGLSRALAAADGGRGRKATVALATVSKHAPACLDLLCRRARERLLELDPRAVATLLALLGRAARSAAAKRYGDPSALAPDLLQAAAPMMEAGEFDARSLAALAHALPSLPAGGGGGGERRWSGGRRRQERGGDEEQDDDDDQAAATASSDEDDLAAAVFDPSLLSDGQGSGSRASMLSLPGARAHATPPPPLLSVAPPPRHWTRAFMGACERVMPEFSAQGLTHLAWALARLARRPDASWTAAFLEAAERKMVAAAGQTPSPPAADAAADDNDDRFSAQGLANVAWALAKLRVRPSPAWMARFCQAAEQRLVMRAAPGAGAEAALAGDNSDDADNAPFTAQGLSLMAWALAKLQYRPTHAWTQAYMRASVEAMRVGNGGGGGSGSGSGGGSVGGVARRPAARHPPSPTASPRDLALAAYALAELRVRPSREWLSAWLDASYPQLDNYGSQSLANTAHALAAFFAGGNGGGGGGGGGGGARHHHHHHALAASTARPPARWVERFLASSQPKLRACAPQALLSLATSLARLRWRPGAGWLAALVDAVTLRLPLFSPGEASATVLALARLGAPLPVVASAGLELVLSGGRGRGSRLGVGLGRREDDDGGDDDHRGDEELGGSSAPVALLDVLLMDCASPQRLPLLSRAELHQLLLGLALWNCRHGVGDEGGGAGGLGGGGNSPSALHSARLLRLTAAAGESDEVAGNNSSTNNSRSYGRRRPPSSNSTHHHLCCGPVAACIPAEWAAAAADAARRHAPAMDAAQLVECAWALAELGMDAAGRDVLRRGMVASAGGGGGPAPPSLSSSSSSSPPLLSLLLPLRGRTLAMLAVAAARLRAVSLGVAGGAWVALLADEVRDRVVAVVAAAKGVDGGGGGGGAAEVAAGRRSSSTMAPRDICDAVWACERLLAQVSVALEVDDQEEDADSSSQHQDPAALLLLQQRRQQRRLFRQRQARGVAAAARSVAALGAEAGAALFAGAEEEELDGRLTTTEMSSTALVWRVPPPTWARLLQAIVRLGAWPTSSERWLALAARRTAAMASSSAPTQALTALEMLACLAALESLEGARGGGSGGSSVVAAMAREAGVAGQGAATVATTTTAAALALAAAVEGPQAAAEAAIPSALEGDGALAVLAGRRREAAVAMLMAPPARRRGGGGGGGRGVVAAAAIAGDDDGEDGGDE